MKFSLFLIILFLLQARLSVEDKEVEFSSRAHRQSLHENETKHSTLERALG
jgi:hypothetical protein